MLSRVNFGTLFSRLAVVSLAAAIVFTSLQSSQAAGPVATGQVAGGPQTNCNIDKLADNIKKAVDKKAVGYSVAIFKNGKLAKRFAGGMARTSADSNPRAMSVNDQLELGSISKTINAMVLLKALEEKGISINSSIYPYLPKSWSIHKSIKDGKITFKKLLAHESGLKQFDRYDESKYGPGNYNDHVKEAVKLGVVQSQSAKYNNNNYELIRVLLAYVVNEKTAKGYEAPGKTIGQESYFASLLAAMAKTRLFYKANIGPSPKLYDPNPASSAVRYYHFPSPTVAGVHGNDRRKYPGRGGWKMTATELAAVLSAWNANQILSTSMTQAMKDKKMGVFYGDGQQGRHYKHNGKSHATKRSGTSQFVVFPDGVVVALLLNSNENAHGNKTTLFVNAYEDACKSPDLIITQFSASGTQSVKNGKVVIPVKLIVKNKGTGTADGKFAVAIKRLGQWRFVRLVDSIAPGKSRIINGELELAGLVKRMNGRTIQLTAMVDAPIAAGDTSIPKTGRVQEYNESNNTKLLSVKIDLPKTPGGIAAKTTESSTPKKPAVRRPVIRKSTTKKPAVRRSRLRFRSNR